jgi:hypothetical protein
MRNIVLQLAGEVGKYCSEFELNAGAPMRSFQYEALLRGGLNILGMGR